MATRASPERVPTAPRAPIAPQRRRPTCACAPGCEPTTFGPRSPTAQTTTDPISTWRSSSPSDHQHPHRTRAAALRQRAQRSRLDTRRRPFERGVGDPAGRRNRRNLPNRRREREGQHRYPANDPRRARTTGKRLRQGRRSSRTRQAIRRRCVQAHVNARLEAHPHRLRDRIAKNHRLVSRQYRMAGSGEGGNRAALSFSGAKNKLNKSRTTISWIRAASFQAFHPDQKGAR